MDPALGRPFRSSRWRCALALVVGCAAVGADVALHVRCREATDRLADANHTYRTFVAATPPAGDFHCAALAAHRPVNVAYQSALAADRDAERGRSLLALAGLLALLALAGGDRESIGLRPSPLPGWRAWLRGGAALGLAVAAAAGPVALGGWGLGWKMDAYVDVLRGADGMVVEACVRAPVLEELVYRVLLGVPLAAAAGPRAAVAGGGVAFGALHVIYGVANPLNVLAGFALAWAFFRSGTLLVPILLHAAGNALLLAAILALLALGVL